MTTSTLINLNFVSPINKVFPSPLGKVFLVFNAAGDLSLYRKSEHVWSAGLFRTIVAIQWSPDSKFIAIICEKKCFIYAVEEGKRVSSVDCDGKATACRWIRLDDKSDTLILIIVDLKSFSVQFSVNCEFQLKSCRLPVANEEILDIQVNRRNNELVVLQKAHTSIFKLPFEGTTNSSSSSSSFYSVSVGQVSKLSKQIQSVYRVLEELKSQFIKLLKLDDSVFARLSEIDLTGFRKLILFGDENLSIESSGILRNLSEANVMEWKSRLKKQHAELLVAVEEVSSLLKGFQAAFLKFCPNQIERFIEVELTELEDSSRFLQHDLAEFLVWLEGLVICDDPNAKTRRISPFKPDTRAIEIARGLERSETTQQNRFNKWIGPFDDLKFELEFEFKGIVDSINNVSFTLKSQTANPSNTFERILSTDPLIFLDNSKAAAIFTFDHQLKIINLPGEYLAHSIKDQVLRVFCRGLGMIQVELEADKISKDLSSTSTFSDDFDDCGDNLFINPDCRDSLFMFSTQNPTKLVYLVFVGN